MSHRFNLFCLAILIFALAGAFFWLPSFGLDVYLSPDETANAAMAQQVSGLHTFLTRPITWTSSDMGPAMLLEVPWLHPRSFVLHSTPRGIAMVPVGFLGFPLLLGFIFKLFGSSSLLIFIPLLAISVLYPLWRLTERWGKWGQVAALIGWLTFPTVILYANRGLFSNLPLVCLLIWVIWLLRDGDEHEAKNLWRYIIAGCLTGLAIIMRPPEILWILPLIVVCWSYRLSVIARTPPLARAGGRGNLSKKTILFFLIPCLMLLAVGLFAHYQTYGSAFLSGYQLRDPVAPGSVTVSSSNVSSVSLWSAWPFGFHPRNVWFNARAYLSTFLWPWFLLSIGALVIEWKQRAHRRWIYVAVWTVAILAAVYGQAVYQDHIKPNQVSLANSYLRYLLPVSVVAVFSLARCVSWLLERWKGRGKMIAVMLMLAIGLFGLWNAFLRDDEGLIANAREITRYARIRQGALLDPRLTTGVILSDRSDKIFFPAFTVASPMPPMSDIHRLMDEHISVAVFIRTLDDAARARWNEAGFDLQEMVSAGNETLYFLLPSP